MKKFSGTITAIVTPFLEDGSVDIGALKKLVEFQIKDGVSGIVACGSTGEAATLDDEEKRLVIQTVVDVVKKRVTVIAGAGSNDTAKAVKLSQIAKSCGADALLHVTPFYNKPTPKGLMAHFKAIAKVTDLPIILYNVPGRTGSNVTAQTTLKIAKEVPQVVGVKEASGNINQIGEIIKGANKNFSVLSGDDALTYPMMALNVWYCAMYPEHTQEFHQAFPIDEILIQKLRSSSRAEKLREGLIALEMAKRKMNL